MNLKTFSQLGRRILINGVEKKLLYWGFDAKGNVLEEPMAVEGGYLLRGEGYNDPTVLHKWEALRNAIQKKGMDSVTEEAAYTWFNRFMAIRILSKNQYDQAQLEYEGDSMTPTILAKARRGQTNFLKPTEKQRLQKVLTDYSKEKEAFAILMIGYCDQHLLLRSIFGRIDDYTELLLPDDTLEKDGFIHLLNTTDAIYEEDYRKVELIGWLYQFYISEKKDKVFASFKKNKKAEARDIPAATQIFTPNWIVKYMVQNTAGKLWLDLHPDSAMKEQMAYLIHDEAQTQAPIISEVAQLKLLDPAVGSGHILVEGFDLLYGMYMEEYYTVEEAVASILQHNLFGLDIDNRAVQLAKFAVLLKAAKYYPEVLQKGWMPQIYAMPEPYPFSRQEVLDFLGKEGLDYEEELSDTLKLMQDGQNLGSAMLIQMNEKTREFLIKRLNALQNQSFQDLGMQSILGKMAPYISILILLSQKYQAIAANPPYMGQGNMNATLKNYINSHYPISKSDLFAVFMEVSLQLNVPNGLMGMINQHSWMFLSSYIKLRDDLISKYGLLNMLHLGPRTFEELAGEVVQSTAFVIQKGKATNTGNYVRLVDYKSNQEKKKAFLQGKHEFKQIPQTNFSKIPGSPIAYWVSDRVFSAFEKERKIKDFFESGGRIKTHGNEFYIKECWEVSKIKVGENRKWLFVENGGDKRKWYGNKGTIVNWSTDARQFYESHGGMSNSKYWSREGLSWGIISSKGASFRIKYADAEYTSASPTIFQKSTISHVYLLAFLNTSFVSDLIKVLNPTVNTTTGDIQSIPVISAKDEIQLIEKFAWQNIIVSKSDWDSRETSWDFEHFPLLNESPDLKSAYQVWQEKVSKDFFILHRNEEELNHIFIDIYGLQEELDPKVPLTEITILQEELDAKKLEKQEAGLREKGIGLRAKEMGLPLIPEGYQLPMKKDMVMKQLISYAIGVNMGRFRLDKPGLNIAHPDPSEEEGGEYLVIRGKGLGSYEQEAIFKYMRHEYQEFSGLTGLAKIHGARQSNLSGNNPFSQGGAIRTGESVAEGGSFDPIKHSRRTSTGNEGIFAVPKNSEGVAGGVGNSGGTSQEPSDAATGSIPSSIGENNRNLQNDQWLKEQAESLIANPNSLTPIQIDEDGIIPLMGAACIFTDDAYQRVRYFLEVVWGEATLTQNLNFLQECLDEDLESYLVKKFWVDHCKTYKKKPIYWLFSSEKGAFQVLAYMHRMNAFTVEKIRSNYLMPHLKHLRSQIDRLEASKEDPRLLDRLQKNLDECEAYDLLLKDTADKQITFDLDDGVSRNYALFEGVVREVK